MFNQKIKLLNENWQIIAEYKIKYKPNINELIYSDKLGKYFSVINVIHSFKKKYELLVIVKPYDETNK